MMRLDRRTKTLAPLAQRAIAQAGLLERTDL